MTQFEETVQEIREVLRTMDIAGGTSKRLALVLAMRMPRSFCLEKNGSGVFTWIKSRLLEMNFFRYQVGLCADEEHRYVTCIFHFDWDRFTPEKSDISWYERQCGLLGFQRSPLSRLHASDPVNRVAHRIAHSNREQHGRHHICPYCREWYQNPAALKFHLLDFHKANLEIVSEEA